MNEVTRILNVMEQGSEKATDDLLPLVYEELRLLAAQKLSHEKPGQTLQATALVHEAYLRLTSGMEQSWENQGHFFVAVAEAMRRILVDSARRKKSQKRGGKYNRVGLDKIALVSPGYNHVEELIALDEALDKLTQEGPIKADVVKRRYFVGLTVDQTAEILGVSGTTATLHWAYAKAWLMRELVS